MEQKTKWRSALFLLPLKRWGQGQVDLWCMSPRCKPELIPQAWPEPMKTKEERGQTDLEDREAKIVLNEDASNAPNITGLRPAEGCGDKKQTVSQGAFDRLH